MASDRHSPAVSSDQVTVTWLTLPTSVFSSLWIAWKIRPSSSRKAIRTRMRARESRAIMTAYTVRPCPDSSAQNDLNSCFMMGLLSAIRPSECWQAARSGRLRVSGRLEAGGIPNDLGIPEDD